MYNYMYVYMYILCICTCMSLVDIDWISSTFRLCSPLTPDMVDEFEFWIQDTWFNLAMGKPLA